MPSDTERRLDLYLMIDAGTRLLNAVAVVACVLITIKLWSLTAEFVGDAGGLPMMEHFTVMTDTTQFGANLPILEARLYWWTYAWVAAVFASGFTLLSIAGVRWVKQQIMRLLA